MTLIFDIGGPCDCRSCASWYFVRVPSANFGDTTTIRFRFMGHWANTAQSDHVTLRPWPLTLEVMAPCGSSSSIRKPSLKFLGFAIQKIWCKMCASINGPSDHDLWPFDLETGMRVASKVGNLLSKFGHARPLGYRIIRYVRDGRTDRRTDKSNAYYFSLPCGGGGIIIQCSNTLDNTGLIPIALKSSQVRDLL